MCSGKTNRRQTDRRISKWKLKPPIEDAKKFHSKAIIATRKKHHKMLFSLLLFRRSFIIKSFHSLLLLVLLSRPLKRQRRKNVYRFFHKRVILFIFHATKVSLQLKQQHTASQKQLDTLFFYPLDGLKSCGLPQDASSGDGYLRYGRAQWRSQRAFKTLGFDVIHCLYVSISSRRRQRKKTIESLFEVQTVEWSSVQYGPSDVIIKFWFTCFNLRFWK